MKIVSLAFAAAVLTWAPLVAQQTQVPIFRYISIAPFGRVDLGGPFPQASTMGATVAPNVFRLVGPGGRPVQFADTEAILVQLTDSHLVQAFYFLYLDGVHSFAEREAEYVTSLGIPARFSYDSGQAHVVRSTWADAQTEFELLEVTAPASVHVLSALRDRHPAVPLKPGS